MIAYNTFSAIRKTGGRSFRRKCIARNEILLIKSFRALFAFARGLISGRIYHQPHLGAPHGGAPFRVTEWYGTLSRKAPAIRTAGEQIVELQEGKAGLRPAVREGGWTFRDSSASTTAHTRRLRCPAGRPASILDIAPGKPGEPARCAWTKAAGHETGRRAARRRRRGSTCGTRPVAGK